MPRLTYGQVVPQLRDVMNAPVNGDGRVVVMTLAGNYHLVTQNTPWRWWSWPAVTTSLPRTHHHQRAMKPLTNCPRQRRSQRLLFRACWNGQHFRQQLLCHLPIVYYRVVWNTLYAQHEYITFNWIIKYRVFDIDSLNILYHLFFILLVLIKC